MNASLVNNLLILAVIAFSTAAGVPVLSQEDEIPEPMATEEKIPDGHNRPDTKEGDKSISINALDEINVESIGLLDEDNGGFSESLWRDSELAQVEELLSQLPIAVRSRATHDLMRTLLLSSATAPIKKQEKSNLLEIRLEALANLGEFESFLDFLAAIPERAKTAQIKQLKSNVLLLMGNIGTGCELVLSQVREVEARPTDGQADMP